MCTVSIVGDFYSDKWRDLHPPTQWTVGPIVAPLQISKEEFDALKREVADLKELLKRAKKYDEENGEPDCEMDEKMALIRKVAEAVGVDLSDLLGPPQPERNQP